MSGLGVKGEIAMDRTPALLTNPIDVTQDPVDRRPVDGEPPTAVNPRFPATGTVDLHRATAGVLPGHAGQRRDVEALAVVVQAEVNVRTRMVSAFRACVAILTGDTTNTWHIMSGELTHPATWARDRSGGGTAHLG